jgi:hypothetical protein
MLTDLQLPGFRKARFWFDEFPDVPRLTNITNRIQIEAQNTPLGAPRQAAIEFSVPLPGFSIYGLLGAEIAPSQGAFQIGIASTGERLGQYRNAIASTESDDIRYGLDDEYAPAVAEGMTRAANESRRLPQANVTCDIAAHGLVGSNAMIFAALGNALMKLLLLEGDADENYLRELVVID